MTKSSGLIRYHFRRDPRLTRQAELLALTRHPGNDIDKERSLFCGRRVNWNIRGNGL